MTPEELRRALTNLRPRRPPTALETRVLAAARRAAAGRPKVDRQKRSPARLAWAVGVSFLVAVLAVAWPTPRQQDAGPLGVGGVLTDTTPRRAPLWCAADPDDLEEILS